MNVCTACFERSFLVLFCDKSERFAKSECFADFFLLSLDPHAYNDYEKFNFSHAKKPYLEFPVLSNGEYEGGSPGADRVVIGSIAEDYSGLCPFLSKKQLQTSFVSMHRA